MRLPSGPERWIRRVIDLLFLFLSASVVSLTVLFISRPELVRIFGEELATRIPRANLADTSVDGIIVLGGSPTRVEAALELKRLFPHASLILSGPSHTELALAESAVVDHNQLYVDGRPTNTYENAIYSSEFVGPENGGCWVLVTSAIHMPRAFGSFQAVSFPILPWPIDDVPYSEASFARLVLREMTGLVGYRVLGKTNAVFPKLEVSHNACNE